MWQSGGKGGSLYMTTDASQYEILWSLTTLVLTKAAWELTLSVHTLNEWPPSEHYHIMAIT